MSRSFWHITIVCSNPLIAINQFSQNVIGHVMNFDAVTMLERNLVEEQMYVHGLQNVWAREVCQVNPLAQAKALFQDL